VCSEEWDDERAKREVGDILQRVVELLNRYAVALQHRQDQVQNPAMAQCFIARGAEYKVQNPDIAQCFIARRAECFFSGPTAKNTPL